MAMYTKPNYFLQNVHYYCDGDEGREDEVVAKGVND